MDIGIHDGVPMRDYLLHPGFSASRAHVLLTQSPRHAVEDYEGEPSDASDMGTAIHDGLLEGVDRIVAVDADDWRTKAAKEARDKARAEGKIPMLSRKVEKVVAAINAAKAFIESSEIAGAFDGGKPEQTVIWKEGEMICKARPDWLSESFLIHVKTTDGSAEPSGWIRSSLAARGYDLAWAFYKRGMENFNYDGLHLFLVIEQNAPYGCSLIGLSPAMADLAERKAERAIRLWQACKASGKYPCYPPSIHYAEPLPWQLADEEERDLSDAFDERQATEGLQA